MLNNSIRSLVLFTICLIVLTSAFSIEQLKHMYDVDEIDEIHQLMKFGLDDQYDRRSHVFHIRPSRNSWFRVSTYQHMKSPNGESEEKGSGDNLLRWG